MQVLVTGHCGTVGQALCKYLQERQYAVRGFDVIEGHDIRNSDELAIAAQECAAIVHCAALIEENAHTTQELLEVNVTGTLNALQAARQNRVQRFVFLSSAAALGIFAGQREPDYLPIDERHPVYATAPYALSKRLSENLCASYARESGATVIALRPPGIFTPEIYQFIKENRAREENFEWTPYWEYGAWIDVRDVCSAVELSLSAPVSGYHELLISAPDVSSAQLNTRQLREKLLPHVEWHHSSAYDAEPFRSLIDNARALQVLGWRPRFSWR